MPFLTRCLIQNLKQLSFTQSMLSAYPNTRIKKVVQVVQVNDRQIRLNKRTPFLRNVLESNLNLTKLIQENKPLSSNDWLNGREELFKMNCVNEKNIDALISNLCFSFENGDAFESYVKYLKDNNLEMNLYIKGTYAAKLASKQNLSESEKQEIFDLYDSVRKQYPVLDGGTCLQFINALCITDRWEESIELLDMMYIANPKPVASISTIIKAAFDNNKPEIGWKYFLKAADTDLNLLPRAYSSYLEYCVRRFKDKRSLEENLLKMFKFCNDKESLMHRNELNDYLAIFQSLGYHYSETTMHVSGKCLTCAHQLPNPTISKTEFEEMSKLFMQKVVVGDNVYSNTTPGEFKRFLQFLENALPYDIVIDGLNVAFAQNNKTDYGRAAALSKAVEYFVNQNKRIVLLGRKHMLRWNNMGFIKHNTKMFLMDNASFDDPHLIYATLYGGMETCFMSGDLMRQHKCLLPKNMQRLFKEWQLSHQYLKHPYTNAISYPMKFETIAQEDKNGWHLPYFINDSNVPKDSYNTTVNWICLRNKPQ